MTESAEKSLIVTTDAYIATITLSRPEKRNALSPVQLIELHQLLKGFEKGDDIRCVVFRGDGDTAFSSGYDISAIPTKVPPEVQEALKKQNPLELALNTVRNFQYPTIAMINGYAFGAGFNLCACCDIRIAADDVRMGMPPAKLGLIYHPGGLQQFIETYGIAGTKDIFLSARTYTGRDLLERGIVDYLVKRPELASFTYTYASKITENAPLSLKGMKKIINMFGNGMSLDEENLKAAHEIIQAGFQSDDLKEGQLAFLEKRKPNFTGK
ncbi:MAG: enoyl-CoA hydratase-related protein [Desulfobacterales bacterium]